MNKKKKQTTFERVYEIAIYLHDIFKRKIYTYLFLLRIIIERSRIIDCCVYIYHFR